MATLNRDLAEAGASTGMALAASHADRVEENWTEKSVELFKLYSRMHRDGFMTEDVRAWAEKLGMPSPPDNRAWGLVARRLSKQGVIKAVGYGKQRSSTCHGSPKTIWRMA